MFRLTNWGKITIKLVLGTRGNLSRELIKSGVCDLAVDRVTLSSWSLNKGQDLIKKFIEGLEEHPTHVINAAGIIDSHHNLEELRRINIDLPRNLIVALNDLDIKIVTVGTVMENFAELSYSNPYLNSKREASELFNLIDIRRYLHFQMHTWYGGENFSPGMFLGQVANALTRNQPFKMSDGNQLREYHHIEDDVTAISEVINSGGAGIIDISHGQPVTLRQLAETIFSSLGKLDLLEVGVLPASSFENHSYVFSRNPIYDSIIFRSALESVPKWIGNLLVKMNEK